MKRYKEEEWWAEATKRFGLNTLEWKFVCPKCSRTISMAEWVDADAVKVAPFKCIESIVGIKADACQYSSLDDDSLCSVEVELQNGDIIKIFDFAPGETTNPPEQKPE